MIVGWLLSATSSQLAGFMAQAFHHGHRYLSCCHGSTLVHKGASRQSFVTPVTNRPETTGPSASVMSLDADHFAMAWSIDDTPSTLIPCQEP